MTSRLRKTAPMTWVARFLRAFLATALIVTGGALVLGQQAASADSIGGCEAGAVSATATSGISCWFNLFASGARFQDIVARGDVDGVGLVGLTISVAPVGCRQTCPPAPIAPASSCGPSLNSCSTVFATLLEDQNFEPLQVTCSWSGAAAALVHFVCQGQMQDEPL